MSRIVIYDKAGGAIADIRARVTYAWRMNQYGQAQFAVSMNEDAAKLQYLEFGNFITVERDHLPMWAGVIDPPRQWGRKAIICNAYSGEYLLAWRRTDVERKLTGTAGEIYQQMIAIANQPGYIRTVAGAIWTGGQSREETLNPTTSIYEEAKRVATRAGHEFNLTPEFDGQGRLIFKANWYERMGVDRVFTLEEGVHIEMGDSPVVEQGNIVNEVVGYGDGAAWASRPKTTVKDDSSIGRYGLRQGSKSFSGNTITGTLEQNAYTELQAKKQPRKTFTITALDVGDTLSNIRLGDRLPVRLVSCGFSGDGFGMSTTVRVKGMAWDDSKGVLEIVCDEDKE